MINVCRTSHRRLTSLPNELLGRRSDVHAGIAPASAAFHKNRVDSTSRYSHHPCAATSQNQLLYAADVPRSATLVANSAGTSKDSKHRREGFRPPPSRISMPCDTQGRQWYNIYCMCVIHSGVHTLLLHSWWTRITKSMCCCSRAPRRSN